MKNQIKTLGVPVIALALLVIALGWNAAQARPQSNPAPLSQLHEPPVLDAYPYPLQLRAGTYRAESLYGPFELKIADGRFTLKRAGNDPITEGTYVVVGGEITFLVKEDEIVFGDKGTAKHSTCSMDDSPYTYAWSLDHDALTLRGNTDNCAQRRSIFTSLRWVRQEQ